MAVGHIPDSITGWRNAANTNRTAQRPRADMWPSILFQAGHTSQIRPLRMAADSIAPLSGVGV